MKISDEITSEIKSITSSDEKDFITWLMDFERSILGNRNPAYKDTIEKKVMSSVSKKAGGNAEN